MTSLDNATIMELDTLPEHLMVLGGGYMGLVFGQMFCRFGSQVTIVRQGKQLLEREDPDVAEREDGTEVLLKTAPQRAEATGDGQIQLTVKTPQEERYLTRSHLLVATGRVPNTEGLGLVR